MAQRIEIVQFLPLDSELPAYLAHRAQAAGRKIDEFIDQDAIDALRSRLVKTDPTVGTGNKKRVVSLCYALTVNNWMTRLLNEAASLGETRITRDVVAAA